MAQKISQMTEQTTSSMTEAGTSDFLGGYTATGGNANRKFSLSGLANYFLSKFKMTLGGSSQTVKSAIDALNSNSYLLTGGTAVPSSANIDEYTEPGNFGCTSSTNARTMSGFPYETGSSSIFAFNLKVENAALNEQNVRRQVLQFFNDRQKWIRYGSRQSATSFLWQSWEREPSRSEVDALNSKTSLINDSQALPLSRYHSTVSFRDAIGAPTMTSGAAKIADDMQAAGIVQYFGTVRNVFSGGAYTVITGGADVNYFSILIFGYNDTYMTRCVYRPNNWYVSRIHDCIGLFG